MHITGDLECHCKAHILCVTVQQIPCKLLAECNSTELFKGRKIIKRLILLKSVTPFWYKVRFSVHTGGAQTDRQTDRPSLSKGVQSRSNCCYIYHEIHLSVWSLKIFSCLTCYIRGVVLTTHPNLSTEVMEVYGYTSTHPLGLSGLLYGEPFYPLTYYISLFHKYVTYHIKRLLTNYLNMLKSNFSLKSLVT